MEFGHRRVQVLAVVDESPRTVRELAERIPLHALTLLADQDGSIREAYAPDGAQCFLIDVDGRAPRRGAPRRRRGRRAAAQADALGTARSDRRGRVEVREDLMDRIAPHELPLAGRAGERGRRPAGTSSRIADDAGLPADVRDAGVLAVSELVTNAVLHGRDPITLRVTTLPRTVRVAVTDGSNRPPAARPAAADAADRHATGGRGNHGAGLTIVERVAEQWGCAPAVQAPGKTVWCNLRVDRPTLGAPAGGGARVDVSRPSPIEEHRAAGPCRRTPMPALTASSPSRGRRPRRVRRRRRRPGDRSRAGPPTPDDVVAMLAAAGLRGRGGAGFPTVRKWATVRDFAAGAADTPTVVVNGAEGEPGSFKDRMLLRRDPFRVLEGALVAAHAVGAPRVVVALKESFAPELARVRAAVADDRRRRVEPTTSTIEVFAGPASYLYGEETALLEVLDGRPPFPRVTPPFRRGVEEVPVPGDGAAGSQRGRRRARRARRRRRRASRRSSTTSRRSRTSPASSPRAPTGSASSAPTSRPERVVCTVSGDAPRHGVAEFAMGTPLREVLADRRRRRPRRRRAR